MTFWNRAAEQLYGYKAEEALGKGSVALLQPAYVNITREELVNKLSSSGHVETESLRQTKDGRKLNIEAHVILLRDEANKPVGYVSVDRDITERKKTQEALRQSEEHFSKAFTASPVAVIITRYSNGCYVDVNETFLRLFEYSCEEVIGRTSVEINIFGNPNGRSDFLCALEPQGRIRNLEMTFRTKTGKLITTIVSAEKIDLDGESHILTTLVDISDRKKAAQELWQAKNDWERTFDTVPDFIAVLYNKHRIVRANKAMTQQLEVKPEQAIGLTCYSCVHGTSIPPEFCPHAKTLQDGKEHVAEVHEPRLGGDFIVSTTPLRDEKGHMIGSVHVARNITERKKAEEALRKLNRHLRAISNSNQALMHAADETVFASIRATLKD